MCINIFLPHGLFRVLILYLLVMSILEEQLYEKKINFFKTRLQTCGYRFYNIIQTRRKEVPKLHRQENNEILQQEVETKVLAATDQFINCLRGEHYSHEIPEYLAPE